MAAEPILTAASPVQSVSAGVGLGLTRKCMLGGSGDISLADQADEAALIDDNRKAAAQMQGQHHRRQRSIRTHREERGSTAGDVTQPGLWPALTRDSLQIRPGQHTEELPRPRR
jgi:hypothetical protein